MKTIQFFAVVLFCFTLNAAESFVKSKEEILFRSPETFKFSSVGKIPEFRGVLERISAQTADLQMVDLYQFKSDAVKVSKELCMSYVEKIFGLSQSKLFALKTFSIEKSNKGQVCEVFISDVNTVKEDPYLRYATIGFVNAKATAVIFHPTSVNDAKVSEIRKFWENLR